jgi:hypothetical protein
MPAENETAGALHAGRSDPKTARYLTSTTLLDADLPA